MQGFMLQNMGRGIKEEVPDTELVIRSNRKENSRCNIFCIFIQIPTLQYLIPRTYYILYFIFYVSKLLSFAPRATKFIFLIMLAHFFNYELYG
jgi:hypothetical protein